MSFVRKLRNILPTLTAKRYREWMEKNRIRGKSTNEDENEEHETSSRKGY